MSPDTIHCHACAATYEGVANFCPECGAENEAFEAPGGTKRASPAVAEDQLPGDDRTAAARYDRIVDREWPLASSQQVLAGLKAGVYATLVGVVATATLAVLSLGFRVLGAGSGSDPLDPGRIDAGSALAGRAIDVVVAPIAAGQLSVVPALKVLAWLFYGAAFVPLEVADGTRRATVDLPAALAPLGVVPFLLHAAVLAALVVFGYRAAGSLGYGSVTETVAGGATVAPGVLAVAIPGLVLASASEGTLAVGPGPLVPGVATLVGLPVACGAVGGGLRAAVRRRS